MAPHTNKEEKAKPRPRIKVLSLDFDGCIFNHAYMTNPLQANRLLATNARLIDQLTKEIEQEEYDEVIFMVGSNRQSKSVDTLGANLYGSGSCYPALMQLCEEFQKRTKAKCRVDGLLLADIYGNRRLGENFHKALSEDKNYPYFKHIQDTSKLTMLYAQIHKIASENPDAEIDFDFYDDRSDIIENLHFLADHPDLFPRNVKFTAHLYNGTDPIEDFSMSGTGQIDHCYQMNTKRLVETAGIKITPNHFSGGHDILNNIVANSQTISSFESFKKERQITPLDVSLKKDKTIDLLDKEQEQPMSIDASPINDNKSKFSR